MGDDLGLIVLESFKDVGEKVNDELNRLRGTDKDYRIPVLIPRFSDGEAKATLQESVRGKDIYILGDTHNYSVTYEMYGYKNLYSPDEHFMDFIRVILAIMGHARRITVVMPFLYASRQHRKKSRESLDCAKALQFLESLGVSEIVTYDAHDPNVQNAVPTLAFDNLYVTNNMLSEFLANEDIDLSKVISVGPDSGATERAKFLADILGVDVGTCVKRRNRNVVVNGQNPIESFDFLGGDVTGKTAIITDDMLASGGSIIEVAEELKKRGAEKVYIFETFGLFTKGLGVLEKAYEDGLIDAIYTTNLTYIPEEFYRPWLHIVDMSSNISEVIDTLNRGESLSELINRNDAAKVYQDNEAMVRQRQRRTNKES